MKINVTKSLINILVLLTTPLVVIPFILFIIGSRQGDLAKFFKGEAWFWRYKL